MLQCKQLFRGSVLKTAFFQVLDYGEGGLFGRADVSLVNLNKVLQFNLRGHEDNSNFCCYLLAMVCGDGYILLLAKAEDILLFCVVGDFCTDSSRGYQPRVG